MKPISSMAGGWYFIALGSSSGFACYSLRDCQLTAISSGYQDQGNYSQVIGWTNNIFQRCAFTFSQNSNPYQTSLYNNLFLGGSLSIYLSWQTWNWTVADNLFDAVSLSSSGFSSSNSYNAFYQTTPFAHQGGTNVTLTNIDFQVGPLGNYYYPPTGTNLVRLIDAGKMTAVAAGLANYTTQTNQTPDSGMVDIGFHYRGSAIRPGFNENRFFGNDDNFVGPVDLPFTVNFFGTAYSSLYVNENGNVTFDGGLSQFTPVPFADLADGATTLWYVDFTNIIAPFWADVDTSPYCSPLVTYGIGTIAGHNAFGVNWVGVGYYSYRMDKINSFQLVLIDRSDRASGDYDVEFNYTQIQWDTGSVSGGVDGLWGGGVVDYNNSPARTGYASMSGSSFEMNGSGTPGALLDSNPARGLIFSNFNTSLLGRYIFQFHNGAPIALP